MANIRDIYDAKYGPHMSLVLWSMDGNPDAIKDYWEDRFDNPTADELELSKKLPGFGELTAEGAADAAYHQIVSEIERLYFGRIKRDVAVGICNALDSTQSGWIYIANDYKNLSYSAYTFCDAWNRHHPDEPKIKYPANDI